MQAREKAEKSRFIVSFQWFVAAEGHKVGSLKRRVRSHLGRWEMKNCTPLWREAGLQVKKLKTSKNTSRSEHSWKLRCRKNARHPGTKDTFPSPKHTMFGPLLEVEMSEKCTPLWREAHFKVKTTKTHQRSSTFGRWHVQKVHGVLARNAFPSQNVKNTTCSDHFWMFRCRFVAGARDYAPCQRRAKPEGFVAVSKALEGVGHLKRICKDAFSVAGAMQETCSSEMLGGPGTDFLRKVAFWSIRSSVFGRWFMMILCDRCSTSYDLASLFSWQTQYFRHMDWKRIGTRQLALHTTFYFWRKSRRIASFLMLNLGSLAEFLRFWPCQVQKLRKSGSIAAFLMLPGSKAGEVSQNSFVLKLADRQIDRQTDRQRRQQQQQNNKNNKNNNNYYYYCYYNNNNYYYYSCYYYYYYYHYHYHYYHYHYHHHHYHHHHHSYNYNYQ